MEAAAALLVQTQDDELTGQALLGDQRGLDDILKDRAGLIQGPLAYDRKHSFFPFFLWFAFPYCRRGWGNLRLIVT